MVFLLQTNGGILTVWGGIVTGGYCQWGGTGVGGYRGGGVLSGGVSGWGRIGVGGYCLEGYCRGTDFSLFLDTVLAKKNAQQLKKLISPLPDIAQKQFGT